MKIKRRSELRLRDRFSGGLGPPPPPPPQQGEKGIRDEWRSPGDGRYLYAIHGPDGAEAGSAGRGPGRAAQTPVGGVGAGWPETVAELGGQLIHQARP